MRICVPYGERFQEADIPSQIPVEVVDPPRSPVFVPIENMINESLDHPIGTQKLEDLVQPGQKISIVVNDQTRPGPHAQMVNAIICRLYSAGVKAQDITIVIATGTHRGPTEDQLNVILGGLQHSLTVHVHDCKDQCHIYVGTTKTGSVPIYLDKTIAESDFIITTGLISPHHSAGFSGGRKSIVPGVASFETLHIHHSLPIRPFDPAINILDGNDFHQVALEAARMVPVRFILNVVQDLHKQIVAAVSGELNEAHMAGVQLCRQVNSVDIHGRGNIIITSPGGHPRDIDLWQSQKALSIAELVCENENNVFILVARAEQGIPALFTEWMEAAKTPQDVIDRFRKEGFDIGSNKAFMYARCMLKGRIILVSESLTKEQAQRVKLDWAPNLQSAFELACQIVSPKRVLVLPRAVNLIPHIIP